MWSPWLLCDSQLSSEAKSIIRYGSLIAINNEVTKKKKNGKKETRENLILKLPPDDENR